MTRSRTLSPIAIAVAATIATAFGGCGHSGNDNTQKKTSADTAMPIPMPDTLRIATLYSPGSYFIYRDQEMGYDYDLVKRLCDDKGMVMSLEVAPSLTAAMEMLDSGKVDILAYEVPVTAEYKERVIPCGPVNVTSQVLVQPRVGRRSDARAAITDVTQLAGREVTVEKGSKYYHRLVNLNNEIGGGIIIRQVDSDSIIADDLIELVNRDSIGLTVVDSDIARINKTYYPNLDINLEISFPQRSAWAVSPNTKWLADSVNAWLNQEKPRLEQSTLLKRYFEMAKSSSPAIDFSFKNGQVSPCDELFRHYAKEIGWDWRLLAAIGFVESRFDPTVVSWAGARGMMQVMPATARAYGVSPDQLTDNETSISTAVKIIKALDKVFATKIKDKTERRKFILAAYNSGHAHILDAIALAEKHQLNPTVWDGNVATALMMKSNPEYFNDPVVRNGYFRGRETFDFVIRVLDFYDKCRVHVKL